MTKRIRRMSGGRFRKITVVLISIVFLGVAVGLFYWLVLMKNKSEQDYLKRISELEKQLEDERLKVSENLENNTENSDETLLSTEEQKREVECSFISLASTISEGDLIDIRIRYPDGSDYIVSSFKKVLALNNETKKIVIALTEEEILLLNSAAVDLLSYNGSRIYVTKYFKADAMPSIVDYLPSSRIADQLEHNPNITSLNTSADRQKRYVLEAHLSRFRNEEYAEGEYESDNWEGFSQENDWDKYNQDETYNDYYDDSKEENDGDGESGLPSKYGGSLWD